MDYFELKDLGDVYVEYLIKEISRGIKDVRRCAIESLILYIKKNYYSQKTNEVMKKIISIFFGSVAFQGRLAFLEFYEQSTRHFSRQFFKTYNLNEAVAILALDKVVEIRKKFLENAIIFRKMIFNEDQILLGQLEEGIKKNVLDKNKFISQVLL